MTCWSLIRDGFGHWCWQWVSLKWRNCRPHLVVPSNRRMCLQWWNEMWAWTHAHVIGSHEKLIAPYKYYVRDVSTKIASITKYSALDFSISWEAHLDVLKLLARLDLKRPNYGSKYCKRFYHIEVGLPRNTEIQCRIFCYACDFCRNASHMILVPRN